MTKWTKFKITSIQIYTCIYKVYFCVKYLFFVFFLYAYMYMYVWNLVPSEHMCTIEDNNITWTVMVRYCIYFTRVYSRSQKNCIFHLCIMVHLLILKWWCTVCIWATCIWVNNVVCCFSKALVKFEHLESTSIRICCCFLAHDT